LKYKAISNEVMNLLGENPATELEDINQEIADLQKDILAGEKAHWDVTELAERVQELRSRKTEIEAGRTAEKRNKEQINNLRESIEKSKDKVLAYDEKLVRNFIKEIKIFPDKFTITVISGAHEDITINTLLSKS
jgi:chromosome segregation ATPase